MHGTGLHFFLSPRGNWLHLVSQAAERELRKLKEVGFPWGSVG